MIPANQITTSLAILLVNWDEGKSYIDNFVPFVGQCIVTLRPKVVSVPELQRKMLDDYGLQIPQNSLKTILKRAAKKGYIQPEHNAYIPNYEALKGLDFETTRQQVARKHNAIIEKLINFASKRYGTTLTIEAAENMLLSYVKQHDIELLNCSLGITPIADIEDKFDKNKYFLINAFVKYNYESDPEGFEYLDTIVKGHMLANALIFPDLGQLQRRFHRTSVYCDTALILRILGLPEDKVKTIKSPGSKTDYELIDLRFVA